MTAPADTETAREQRARKIKEVSAEGRPAAPSLGGRRMALLLVLFGAAFLVAGVVLGVTVNWPTGLAAMAVGLAVFILSPMFWTAVLRARERGRAARELKEER